MEQIVKDRYCAVLVGTYVGKSSGAAPGPEGAPEWEDMACPSEQEIKVGGSQDRIQHKERGPNKNTLLKLRVKHLYRTNIQNLIL